MFVINSINQPVISEWNSPPNLEFLYLWNAVSAPRLLPAPDANRCEVTELSGYSLPLAVSEEEIIIKLI